jgi:hypothetical protein
MTSIGENEIGELKPCPWCASSPVVERVNIGDCDWRCSCPNWNECEAQPETFGATRKEAIAAWNTRTPEAADKLESLSERICERDAEIERLRAELDEESAWDAVVGAHGGLDAFDKLADVWVAREPIKRMFNASCSVFAKWSNDELMERFKNNLTAQMHQAFVEGCMTGSRARAALAHPEGITPQEKDGDGE